MMVMLLLLSDAGLKVIKNKFGYIKYFSYLCVLNILGMGNFALLIPIIFIVDLILYMSTPDRHPEEYKIHSLWRILPLSGYVLFYQYKRRQRNKRP